MMTKSNTHQVGGKHYRADFQHWDWVAHTGLGYMEGQITRYVVRWDKKNLAEDLKKALHYIEKTIELAREIGYNKSCTRGLRTVEATKLFYKSANIPLREQAICDVILYWRTESDLYQAHGMIRNMIRDHTDANA